MGHLVNPISARLGIVRIWNSTWVSNKGLSYSYLLTKDLELQKSLEIFFYKTNNTDYWATIFDKALIFRTTKRIYVFIVLYSFKFFEVLDRIFKDILNSQNGKFVNAFLSSKELKKFKRSRKTQFKKFRKFKFKKKPSKSFGRKAVHHRFNWQVKKYLYIYSRAVVKSFIRFRLWMCTLFKRELRLIFLKRLRKMYLDVYYRYITYCKMLKDYLIVKLVFKLIGVCLWESYNQSFDIDYYKFQCLYLLNVFSKKQKLYYFVLKKYFSSLFFDFMKQRISSLFLKPNVSKYPCRARYSFFWPSYFWSKRKYCRYFLKAIFRGNFKFRFIKRTKRFRRLKKLVFLRAKRRYKWRLKRCNMKLAFVYPLLFSKVYPIALYLKALIKGYNCRLKLLLSLFKHSYTWWVFVLLKMCLRRYISNYYGKKLWYIRSFVNYFFTSNINKQTNNLSVFFLFPSSLILTAKLISYVIRIRLTQKYSLGEILNKFVALLDKQSELIGYRITCHGRFTRRQRASHRLVKSSLKYRDRLLLNTFTGVVDYAYVEQPLKYGMCGVRIWLVRDFFNYENNVFRHSLKHFVLKVASRYRLRKLAKLKFIVTQLRKIKKYLFRAHKSKNRSTVYASEIWYRLSKYLRTFSLRHYKLFIKLLGFPFKFKQKHRYSAFFIAQLKKKFFLLY